MNEAINSLRNLFLVSLAVLFLWFVTVPSAIEKLRTLSYLRYVHAWLALSETIRTAQIDPFEAGPDEAIANVLRDVCDRRTRGECYETAVPLAATATWPVDGRYPLTLQPADLFRPDDLRALEEAVRLYKVDSPGPLLPLRDYYVVFAKSGGGAPEFRIVPTGAEQSMRDNLHGLRAFLVTIGELNRPKFWNEIQPHLRRHGYAQPSPGQLAPDNTALVALQAEADLGPARASVQVFGVQIGLGTFVVSVGVFLAVVAFAMIGPIMRLRAADGEAPDHSWIMALVSRSALTQRTLEPVILLVSLLWAMTPLAILFLLSTAGVDMAGINDTGRFAGAVGLAFSSAVFLWAAWTLRGLRRRTAPPA